MITLTPSQESALSTLRDFATKKTDYAMLVLEGWAGTGKTTLVGQLLKDPDIADLKVAIAAPTNKAVRVLREKLMEAGVEVADEPVDDLPMLRESGRVAFGSIHSFLGLQLSELDNGDQSCKKVRDSTLHQFDLVVIDECSMIGAELFSYVTGLKRETLILWVGDPAQLPPIEVGPQGTSPTFSRVMHKLTLLEVVRQARDNPIIAFSIEVRKAIEQGQRPTMRDLAELLPPSGAKAVLLSGGELMAQGVALYELQQGRDARIVAYRNDVVQRHNAAIHFALHGATETPFVPGERVIVHQATEGFRMHRGHKIKVPLITSEELTVLAIEPEDSPDHPEVPAYRVSLETDSGETVEVYLARKQEDLDHAIREAFSTWRRLKADAGEFSGEKAAKMMAQAKAASAAGWKLRKAFAPLRHSYAITSHKSQGSTFDSSIVDLADLSRMRSAFDFSRALYVAATRASDRLALVA